jgi:hypothetical protein
MSTHTDDTIMSQHADDQVTELAASLSDVDRMAFDEALMAAIRDLDAPRRARAINHIRTAVATCGGDPAVLRAGVSAVSAA